MHGQQYIKKKSGYYVLLDVTRDGIILLLARGQNNATLVGDSVLDEVLGFAAK